MVIVMLQAARTLNQGCWFEIAHHSLRKCLERSRVALRAVEDSSLCRGSAGVAHMFNRIYQNEKDPKCLEAAYAWFERTLELAVRKHETRAPTHSGSCTPPFPQVKQACCPLQADRVGTALAFLAALTSVEPNWDRILLLSSRFSEGGVLL